jgi:DNA replication protein DnaC
VIDNRESRMKLAGLEGSLTDEDWVMVMRQTWKETRSVQAVTAWLEAKTLCLALFGTTGCGKTVACAIGLASVGGRYLHTKRLERLFLAQFGPALEEQESVMNRHGLLVIDDIGTELHPETFASSLYEVLDRRQGAGRRTIITANMPKGDFEKRYGDHRLLSRMKRADVVGDATTGDMRRK